MKLLHRDQQLNWRTWRNPRNLEKLASRSPLQRAVFVLTGEHLIASTGPYLSHSAMLWNVGLPREEIPDGLLLFRGDLTLDEIGSLRGQVTRIGSMIEFGVPDHCPMRQQTDGSRAPDVSADAIALIMEHCRGNANMRAAFPHGMRQLGFHVSNYAGFWVYKEGRFTLHSDWEPPVDDCRLSLV
jgi:hypothetical protein